MRSYAWRQPSAAERDVATRWLAAWNDATGDQASLPEGWLAADSCGCGTCPSFAVTPVDLLEGLRDEHPLCVEGGATRGRGSPVAGLIAFWSEQILDIEVYPYGDGVVKLEKVRVSFFVVGSS